MTTTYLADTNVISELSRHKPDVSVAAWAEQVATLGMSVISVEEILYGLASKPNARVRGWFEDFMKESTVFGVTYEIAARAGELRGQLRSEGHVRSQADMLVAATALVHGLTVVTRNVRDFEGCRIALLNPFTT